MPDYVSVEQRMLNVLSDYKPHILAELHVCLEDTLGPLRNVHAHLTSLRKKLRPIGETILCERIDGVAYFRHVRLVASTSRE